MSQKSGKNMDLGPAGPVIWFLLAYLANRILDAIKPKRQHVLGVVAMGTGWTGLSLFSAVIFVWNAYVVVPDVPIAIHSGIGGTQLLAALLITNLNFGLVCWFLIALELNGIVTFSEHWWPARAARKLPMFNRFVINRNRKQKTLDRYFHHP